MLENDPPPGTRVRFVRGLTKGLRTAKANEIAYLVRPLQKYAVERATDEFEVQYLNEPMIFQRQDIDKA